MTMPLVSCICPTYNRPPSHKHLVEEAIESFLRQTYPNKELVVLNDCPGQDLLCDAPGVRVVNVPERFPTLGEKRNAGVALARGDLIAPWDDDDISLPWRLSLSVDRIDGTGYFNPGRSWFWDGAGLHREQVTNVGHNLSLFARDAFEAAGGYPAISVGEDAELETALRACTDRVREDLTRDEVYYIYRWGVSPVHVSGRGEDGFYREIGGMPAVRGVCFRLVPRWREDYVAATRRLLEA
jgi:glycosyltransferase involved in cell wall biosynthesis